jgi:hypothetical protein
MPLQSGRPGPTARASKASGVASSATITRMVCARRIAVKVPQFLFAAQLVTAAVTLFCLTLAIAFREAPLSTHKKVRRISSIGDANSLSRGSGMPIQAHGVLVHAMSGTELSRVRTEFRLRLPEPINKCPLESRGPTLLCNQVKVNRQTQGRFRGVLGFPKYLKRRFVAIPGTLQYSALVNR